MGGRRIPAGRMTMLAESSARNDADPFSVRELAAQPTGDEEDRGDRRRDREAAASGRALLVAAPEHEAPKGEAENGHVAGGMDPGRGMSPDRTATGEVDRAERTGEQPGP